MQRDPDVSIGRRWVVLIVVAVLMTSACAAGRAFRQGERSAAAGDFDAAAEYFRRALQEDPDHPEYKIALERAMLNASRAHLAVAREFEQKDDLQSALLEYRRAIEFDPTNGQAAARATAVERTLRERVDAARPRPPIEQLREQARIASQPPLLNPASREPLDLQFVSANLRDILNFIGNATGINVQFLPQFQERAYTVQLDGVTLEEALDQILTANQLFYKVINQRTILIIPDTPQNRAQYEEQAIRTFYVSHADVQELSNLLNTIARVPQMPVQPAFVPNVSANTITVRATTAVMAIIEQVIAANDKPRAEVIIDVEILEVNRERAKQFGLNLTQFAVGGIFSPEVAPPNQSTPPDAVAPPPPFNLNTISQGVSTADFYLAVPAAIVRFLESDSQTRLIAKPQLRGQEGEELTLNLGEDIPVPATAFTPIAAGGVSVNPLTSFNYRPVGVIVTMTPRVTYEDEIVLDLTVENSTLGPSINVAGSPLPTFGSRRVVAKLRLRDGESNLLAGLLREEERRSLRGFPGAIRLPGLRQLFSDNEDSIKQTDIVMLLTPRIVRTHELTQQDLSPIHIGTQRNIGLTGPPPLIAPPPADQPPAAATPPGAAAAPPTPAPGAVTTPQPGVQPGATPPAPSPPPTPPPPIVAPPPSAQIVVTPPGLELLVGGGPYTVPLSINGASQVTTVSLTLTFDPMMLRVRTVQEGSFMRQGSAQVTFSQQVDGTAGRVDIILTRTSDATGASGSGLLAAIQFDAIGPGSLMLTPSGVALTPSGAPINLQFSPVLVNVR